jgi:hypothetical protein
MTCSICLGSCEMREDKLNASLKSQPDFPNINKTETDLQVLPSRTSFRNRILGRMILFKRIRQLRSSCRKSLDRCIRRCDGEPTGDAAFMYTPCHHLFHAECLRAWMEIKNSCPECRRHLPVEQESPRQP